MRQLRGNTQKLFYVYVVAMGLFHLYTAIFGNYEAYLQRSIHLTWVLPMCFVLYPISSKAPKEYVPLYDWILAFISTLPGIYNMINYTHIIERIAQVDPLTTTQLVMGTLLLVILLEATRRVVGVPLTIIAAFFAGYMYFGHHMPGIMKGLSFTFEEVIEHIYLTGEGIFSVPLGVSAAFVMIFLIFGGFLEKSGVGEYFMHLAEAFTGTQAGGPAKIAVVSSALFGSISGSAVANVYGTGTFTIPLMKRIGYPAHFAGAVEAVASAGGQIMPPIMGAGAFIMASFLGRPYSEVMIAATLPAILYYGAVIFMV
ncbi:MAG: C4-dicarboxylate ABC transporter permease, partial [Synergistetes bacterium HGW-Synergistetes-2]